MTNQDAVRVRSDVLTARSGRDCARGEEERRGEGITTLAKNLDVTGTFGPSCVGRARGGDRQERGEEGGQRESDLPGLLDFEDEKNWIEMDKTQIIFYV